MYIYKLICCYGNVCIYLGLSKRIYTNIWICTNECILPIRTSTNTCIMSIRIYVCECVCMYVSLYVVCIIACLCV